MSTTCTSTLQQLAATPRKWRGCIVFGVGGDPVQLSLVASIARPGGNVTGINFFVNEVAAKRLRLLHDLVPKAVRIAVLLNPANARVAETTLRDVQEAAPTMGLQVQLTLNANTIGEIDAAFATLAHWVAPKPLRGLGHLRQWHSVSRMQSFSDGLGRVRRTPPAEGYAPPLQGA